MEYIGTTEAAKLTGMHATTIKRWARRNYTTNSQKILKEKTYTGGYRYKINKTFLMENFKTSDRPSSALSRSDNDKNIINAMQDHINTLKEQLSEKDKQIELLIRKK